MPHADSHSKEGILDAREGPIVLAAVACIDLADYWRMSVRRQMAARDRLNELLVQSLADIPGEARIVLDSEAGVAVVFPDGAATCLQFAFAVRQCLDARSDDALQLRIGINLGPVRSKRDHNDQPVFFGDGIAAGMRIAAFADAGDILASRSFYEAIAALSPDYAACFAFEGTRTDTQVRDHQLYLLRAERMPVVPPGEQPRAAERSDSAVAKLDRGLGAMRTRLSRRPALATVAAVTAILIAAFMLRPGAQQGPSIPVSEPIAGSTIEPRPGVLEQSSALQPDSTFGSTSEASPAPDAFPSPQTEASLSAPATGGEPELPPQPNVAPRWRSPTPGSEKPLLDVPARPAAPPAVRGGAMPAETVPKTQAPDPIVATGSVRLTVVPWGEVYLDGAKLGVAPPLRDVVLEPGVYRFEIRNPGFASLLQIVEVNAGEEIRIRHRFD
jgi:class 3 adenylate cyclase